MTDMEYSKPLTILWDYLQMHQEVRKADVIVGFGCYDDNVARRAAELYLKDFGACILFTGGLGRNTTGLFSETEALRFAKAAMACGVPEEAILLESKSTNTRENIEFTRALLTEKGIEHRHILGVHKPYMERRIYAAMGVYWPEQSFSVTSSPMSMEDAIEDGVRQGMEEKEIVSTIVGDFQRIELYAQKGYQLPQYIPEECRKAYGELIAMGYDSQLAK